MRRTNRHIIESTGGTRWAGVHEQVALLERAIRRQRERVYVVVQRHLHLAKGSRASGRGPRRRSGARPSSCCPTVTTRRADRVRRSAELAKRSETAIYAIGLRQADIGRPSLRSESSAPALTGTGGARSSRPRSRSCRRFTSRSPSSCRASTGLAYASRIAAQWRLSAGVVRVTRPNLTARTRQGYYGPTQ